MWNLEKDPYLASSFANVTLLDRPPDPDRLRVRLAQAIERRSPGCASAWPRRSAGSLLPSGRTIPTSTSTTTSATSRCHSPATERTLFDLAAVLAAAPFDRTRPLWEFTIIDGVGNGGAALFQKIHHTVTDGEGGVRMSAEFLDFSREGMPDAPPEPLPAQPAPSDDAPTDPASEPPASIFATASETASHNLRRGLGLGQPRRRAVRSTCSATPSASRRGDRGGGTRCSRSVARCRGHRSGPLAALDRAFAAQTIRGPAHPPRRHEARRQGARRQRQRPVRRRRQRARQARYHRAKGVDVDELRISMPVSHPDRRLDGGQRVHAGTAARARRPDRPGRALHCHPRPPDR